MYYQLQEIAERLKQVLELSYNNNEPTEVVAKNIALERINK